MTTDPSGETAVVDAETERPLFDVGSTEERMRAVTHSLLLVITAILAASVLVATAQALLATVGVTEEATPVAFDLAGTSVNFAGYILVCAAYLVWFDSRSIVQAGLPSLRSVAVIIGGFVVLLGALTGLEFLFSQAGLEPAENSAVQAGEGNPELYLYMIPVVILLNAPAEELLFRGIVQGRFRQAYGVVPGVLAASAIFGLVHWGALVGSGSGILVYVAIAAASGLIFGAAYEYTENLTVPIVMHALWNVGIYTSLYLGATGGL